MRNKSRVIANYIENHPGCTTAEVANAVDCNQAYVWGVARKRGLLDKMTISWNHAKLTSDRKVQLISRIKQEGSWDNLRDSARALGVGYDCVRRLFKAAKVETKGMQKRRDLWR